MDPIPSLMHVFDVYRKHELPEDMPEYVIAFIRHTFVAGAASALQAVDTISRTADTPIAGMAALAALREEISAAQMREIEQFLHDAMNGDHKIKIRIVRMPE
jgi:hypothetical protein